MMTNHSDELVQVQRHLQLRIEAQGKYLQAVLEKAQETLGRQNLGIVGIEAAKVQLSELVSKVSSQCLNSAFSSELNNNNKELHNGFCPQPTDCSMDSSLTSCEGSQRDHHQQEMQNGRVLFNTAVIEAKKNNFLNTLSKNSNIERSPAGNLTMSIGIEGETTKNHRSSNNNTSNRRTEEDAMNLAAEDDNSEKVSRDHYRLPPYFATARLDLNTHNQENDGATSCKQLDLNGFSWN